MVRTDGTANTTAQMAAARIRDFNCMVALLPWKRKVHRDMISIFDLGLTIPMINCRLKMVNSAARGPDLGPGPGLDPDHRDRRGAASGIH